MYVWYTVRGQRAVTLITNYFADFRRAAQSAKTLSLLDETACGHIPSIYAALSCRVADATTPLVFHIPGNQSR